MNYALLALILYFVILLVAVTKEKKNENVLDYFFGGRKLPFWALSITFIASWWGAGSAISTADLAYEDGIGAFWYYGVPVLLSTFLMIVGARAIRRVGYLTQGEMMKARYNSFVAKAHAILILLFMTFTAASQMVGVGDFFGVYLGVSYEVAVVIGTAIVLIYSMFGGFRGVVLTDIIQFVLLVISAIIIFFIAWNEAGGFEQIRLVADAQGKNDYFSITAGAEKYFGYVITFGCAWMIQANVWQRISATKNDSDAKRMTVMSFFAYIPLYLIVVFTGMAGIAIFDTMPEGGVVTAIVTQYMSPLVAAIVFVGIGAAIMSTMDSVINTGAMTLVMDIIPTSGDDKRKLRLSRSCTLIITMIAIIIALYIRDILAVSWIASDIITTGVFVPLLMGFFWKRGNSSGALASIVVGIIYCSYNLLISNVGLELPSFWEPGSIEQVLLGVSMSLILYVGVSLLTKSEHEKAESFIKKALTRKV